MTGDAASGKGVVVTGAARGIGRALAERLVKEGARVVVSDVLEDELLDVAERTGAHPVPGDAASDAGVRSLHAAARDQLGDIDIWFANAGIDCGRGLSATEDDWDAVLNVNLLAHVRAARLLVPDWVSGDGGRFVITASAAGLLTMLGSAGYSTTKHAAVGFAEWLSATYRHRGVVVQAICPQGVQTSMLDQMADLREVLSHDRALTPEDVADAVCAGLAGDQFLILPHPEVAGYYAKKASGVDAWLAGMNRLQQKLETRSGRPLPGASIGGAHV